VSRRDNLQKINNLHYSKCMCISYIIPSVQMYVSLQLFVNLKSSKGAVDSVSPGMSVFFMGDTLNPLIGYWSGVLAGARIRTSFFFPVLKTSDTTFVNPLFGTLSCTNDAKKF